MLDLHKSLTAAALLMAAGAVTLQPQAADSAK